MVIKFDIDADCDIYLTANILKKIARAIAMQ